jgi:hypothetical protein
MSGNIGRLIGIKNGVYLEKVFSYQKSSSSFLIGCAASAPGILEFLLAIYLFPLRCFVC